MLAYHGDPAIKDKYLSRMRAHRAADELVAGVGFKKNGKVQGCAVGCTFDVYDHSRGPIEIGVPEVLIRLEDSIFEGLARSGTGPRRRSASRRDRHPPRPLCGT
jgi:hypothetical protein